MIEALEAASAQLGRRPTLRGTVRIVVDDGIDLIGHVVARSRVRR